MITAADFRALVELTERNDDPRARVAEHLVRAALALSPPAVNPIIAGEQIAMTARALLEMEPK